MKNRGLAPNGTHFGSGTRQSSLFRTEIKGSLGDFHYEFEPFARKVSAIGR
jgi:hypothetical protein